MADLQFQSQQTVAEVLALPGTVQVLLRSQTACVGCGLARFCTLRDVALTYGLDLERLLAQLAHSLPLPPFPSPQEHNHEALH